MFKRLQVYLDPGFLGGLFSKRCSAICQWNPVDGGGSNDCVIAEHGPRILQGELALKKSHVTLIMGRLRSSTYKWWIKMQWGSSKTSGNSWNLRNQRVGWVIFLSRRSWLKLLRTWMQMRWGFGCEITWRGVTREMRVDRVDMFGTRNLGTYTYIYTYYIHKPMYYLCILRIYIYISMYV